MSKFRLLPNLIPTITDYLDVKIDAPTISLLNTLVSAYARTVPWESASRIAKRAQTESTADCPRWPDEFWTDAIERGTGGTCFESNYAFFGLLQAIGYGGYLTINNMGASVGCHTAIVLLMDDQKWLVDAGMPIYVPLEICPTKPIQHTSPFHTYTVQPDGENIYQIERTHHPKPNMFTLHDTPVPDKAYRAATTADYEPDGHFLDRVIINKVVDDVQWRFCSSDMPLHLESYPNGKPIHHPLHGDIAQKVGDHFGMDAAIIHMAISEPG